MADISFGTALLTGLLGYIIVFFGLILLMLVVMLVSRFMMRSARAAAPVKAEAAAAPAVPAAPARGTAGELKLYDTDPRDAAMIMAIVADSLGKPLNELRFISIKEVK